MVIFRYAKTQFDKVPFGRLLLILLPFTFFRNTAGWEVMMLTIEEMKERKRILGYSNETLAAISGVPAPTIQKVLSGQTKSPRQKTLQALSDALADKSAPITGPDTDYPSLRPRPAAVREGSVPYGSGKGAHTIEEIYALPDDIRAELIDGELYYMAAPTRTHQRINGELYLIIANYIRSHGGKCEVYIPPFGVFLNGDDSAFVIPDLTVVCDTDKLEERGCVGAPDWVVEIVSPSSRKMDGIIKAEKYRQAGVREFWLIHPDKRTVLVYRFDCPDDTEAVKIYSFDDEIPSGIYPDLTVSLKDF